MAIMETLEEIDRQIATAERRIEWQLDDISAGIASDGAEQRINVWRADLAALKSKRHTMMTPNAGYLY